MPSLPRDRAYIEVTEALTWIAFGMCVNAATVLQQSIRASEEHGRWEGWCLEDLEAYLQHVVEGTKFDDTKHGPADEWLPRVERLKRTREKDDRSLLDELRPYRATVADEKARIDAAERQLLEAARAEKLQLLGTPVPRGAKPDSAADPEPIPVTYLLKPVAVSLSYNRLTCDWDADVAAIRGWTRDYADLSVKTADVARLWPHGGVGAHLDASGARAFDRTFWHYPMLLTWVYLRDRARVEQAAGYGGSPIKLELVASIRRSDPDTGPLPQLATCTDAETDIINKLQSGALIGLGLENGNGDAKEIPQLYWATAKIRWDREPFAGPEDKLQCGATRRYGLRFRGDRILSLWPDLTAPKRQHVLALAEVDRPPNEPTILFLTLARGIGADPAHGRTIDHNLAQLLRDAVLGAFAPPCLGWNAHENLHRLDPEEYPRLAVRPVTAGGRLAGYVPDEAPSFEAITPIGIVHWLAELGHADALAALDLAETDARRRVAEAELPPDGSRTRFLVESLAITIGEARRFCRRHRLPIPENLRESPIAWSETARIDAITVAELPHMTIAEVARRWAQELGENGLGEDMIRRAIWRAFWRGELASNDGLLIPLKAKGPYPEQQLERFTRAKLLLAFVTVAPDPLPFSLERTPEIDTDGGITDATDADYCAAADQWDEVVGRMEQGGWRAVYIDRSMIERKTFLAWCEAAPRRKPSFWNRPEAARKLATQPAADLLLPLANSESVPPAGEPPATQANWHDRSLPIMTRAELWLKETIQAGWMGTFEVWHGEAIEAGIDISQRQFRQVWNSHASDEMKRPGRKTKNMPELPPRE